MASIAFLGPEGTFTHEAAQHWAGPDTELTALDDIRAVYLAAESGAEDFGVVAIENSVEGYVVPSLDLLLGTNVVAIDEFQVDIAFDAYVLPDSTPDHLAVVSHPHALAQCTSFIERLGVPTRTSLSTAAACRDLQRSEVAIAPGICGEMYGLTRLASHVEDFSGARTRFLLVTARHASREAVRRLADRASVHTMIAVTPQVTGPGVLARLTNAFADRSINLTSLISRPLKGQESKYSFVLTLAGHPSHDDVRGALEEALRAGDLVRTLGVFPSLPTMASTELLDVVPPGSVRMASHSSALSEALLWD